MLSKMFTDARGRTTNLQTVAPDVNCRADDKLTKATMSDHGYVIIGMFFEPGIPGHTVEGIAFQDGSEVLDDYQYCPARKDQGFNSGMGAIFRKVAEITPVDEAPSP